MSKSQACHARRHPPSKSHQTIPGNRAKNIARAQYDPTPPTVDPSLFEFGASQIVTSITHVAAYCDGVTIPESRRRSRRETAKRIARPTAVAGSVFAAGH